jgi:hypothetical protein
VARRAGHSIAAVPDFLERRYLSLPFVKDRVSAFDLGYQLRMVSNVTVHLPEKLARQLDGIPRREQGPFSEWEITAPARGNERELRLRFAFHGVGGVHEPARYAEAVDSYRAPLATLNQPLEW